MGNSDGKRSKAYKKGHRVHSEIWVSEPVVLSLSYIEKLEMGSINLYLYEVWS